MVLPDAGPRTGSILPEGAYLLERRGILVPVGEDRWAFVFDADAGGQADPPMYLIPCLQLSEMVRLTRSRAETITFFLDGEVFVYANQNYLLPLRYEVGVEETHSPEEELDAAIKATNALSGDERDPSVESLVERLERATPAATRRAPVTPQPAGGAPAHLVPEQTPIVSRRGRMVRTGAGPAGGAGAGGRGVGAGWSFMPDNDADTTDPAARMEGRAFLLQPCLNTQEIERLAERYADRVVFVVSGAVYVFEGRNYLMPTMYLIERGLDANLTSAQ